MGWNGIKLRKSTRHRSSQRGCCSSPCCCQPRLRWPCSTLATSSQTCGFQGYTWNCFLFETEKLLILPPAGCRPNGWCHSIGWFHLFQQSTLLQASPWLSLPALTLPSSIFHHLIIGIVIICCHSHHRLATPVVSLGRFFSGGFSPWIGRRVATTGKITFLVSFSFSTLTLTHLSREEWEPSSLLSSDSDSSVSRSFFVFPWHWKMNLDKE